MKRLSLILAVLLLVGSAAVAGDHPRVTVDRHHAHAEEAEPRGYMGVTLSIVQNIGEGEQDNGVYIDGVMADSAAEVAGLRAKDQILEINGTEVSDMHKLHQAMAGTRPDETIDVRLVREGVEEIVSIRLREAPHDDGRWAVVVDEKRAFLGVHIERLGSQLADYFDVEGGLLITEVVEGAPAQLAGIEAGDVVVEIENKPTTDRGTLHEVLAGMEPGDEVVVRVQRRGVPMTFYVEAGNFPDHHSIDREMLKLHHLMGVGDEEGNVEIVLPDTDHRMHLREQNEKKKD